MASTEIAESSGNPAIDAAALKVARTGRFQDAQPGKPKQKLSCIKLRVTFVVRDGELVVDQ